MAFTWVAAAQAPLYMSGIATYVRYKRSNVDKFEIVAEDLNSVHYRTPDREIKIVRDLHYSYGRPTREWDTEWDEILFLNPGFGTFKDFNLKFLMTNQFAERTRTSKIEDFERNQFADFRKPNHPNTDGSIWIADSGGFQVHVGLVDWLDPIECVDWYNTNADIGVAIDIPASKLESYELLKATSKVQSLALDLMRPRLHKSKEFMNVVHGFDPDSHFRYLDTVHRDDIKRCGIPALTAKTFFDALYRIAYVTDELSKRGYKHAHLLGISDTRLIFPVAALVERRYPHMTITADSSSAAKASFTWGTYQWMDFDTSSRSKSWRKADLPHVPFSSVNRMLPCSCPVCSSLRYADLFARSNRIPQYLMMYHNIFELYRFIDTAAKMARTLTPAQYRDYALTQLPASDSRTAEMRNTVERCLDMVDCIMAEGPKKAAQKFSSFMGLGDMFSHLDELKYRRREGEKKEVHDGKVERLMKVAGTFAEKLKDLGKKYEVAPSK